MGLQVSPLFPVDVAKKFHVFVSVNFIDKWTELLTIKQKFYNLQPFAIMVGGQVAIYPSRPHALITKFIQPFHNCTISTVKELSVIFWRAIRALAYDLHQLIYNFKYHAPLRRFAWYIADAVRQLLKISTNYQLAKRLFSKTWNRFQEELLMLNNGFYKRRRWMRHIRTPCRLIDYFKTSNPALWRHLN